MARAPLRLSFAALLALSCTSAVLEPKASQSQRADDRLALKGRVCTSPPDPRGFPVKVVLVIDQSGSMCVSDPPGSQGAPGFCERAEVQAIIPPGVTRPGRVRALEKLLAQFAAQPNVQVAIVPFETNVKNVWPPTTTGARFARPDGTLEAYVNGLQSQLGKGTDYQGAIAYAYTLIASDINAVASESPELLPRTRYVTVFLTDGTPYPRCAANDNLGSYADPNNPDLIWQDQAGLESYCNNLDPNDPDKIDGFLTGTDRNQNYQLFDYVDQLMELKSQFNVGDLRFHSVLLFNQAAVEACGPICADIYNRFPNTPIDQNPAAARKVATWLLKQLASRGNGVFQEFANSEVSTLALGALDYSSLASRNVMKSLRVEALSSAPGEAGRVVDSDGDGLPDDVDNAFTARTNNFFADSDGDCFDDNFEVLNAERGFKPDEKDGRGCDPLSPLSLGCRCRDTDGDGLSQFAEAFLGTQPSLVDSDGDGISDGAEVRYGLDPLRPDVASIDTDGDGFTDGAELKAGSHPTRRDGAFVEAHAYQYEAVPAVQPDGSVCYDYSVTNLQLVTPPSRAGVRQGYNLFKLSFVEAPESGVATDYGVWKVACAWAQYDPPTVREPAGTELTVEADAWRAPQALADPAAYQTGCGGVAP